MGNDLGFSGYVLRQLNAEISAAGYSVRSFAAALDRDYYTIRRYLNGERELPMTLLWAMLEKLSLREDVFVARADERRRTEQDG